MTAQDKADIIKHCQPDLCLLYILVWLILFNTCSGRKAGNATSDTEPAQAPVKTSAPATWIGTGDTASQE